MSMIDALALLATDIVDPFPHVAADQDRLQLMLSTFFGILAAAALLVIVIAGLRYITSTGDPNTAAKLRNTIIYAAVGLVVAMIAFAVVSFVLGRL